MTLNLSKVSIISSVHSQMVEIPPGEIELRDDRTKQQWAVTLAPFLLSKFPVTQGLYFEIMNE